jgi:hypothetical protein
MTVVRIRAGYRSRCSWIASARGVGPCGTGALGGSGLLGVILGMTVEVSSRYALAGTAALAFAAVRCAPPDQEPATGRASARRLPRPERGDHGGVRALRLDADGLLIATAARSDRPSAAR